jgi:hypothetical protein
MEKIDALDTGVVACRYNKRHAELEVVTGNSKWEIPTYLLKSPVKQQT